MYAKSELPKFRIYCREKHMPEQMGIAATLAGNNKWLEAAATLRSLASYMEGLDSRKIIKAQEP